MKIIKNIFIIGIIINLTGIICGFVLINLLSVTVFNKDFVVSQLDQSDYYNRLYHYVESNFKKYINQSGFDEEVLSEIITVDQIKKDTNIILDNIYENQNKKINTDTLKENLKENIDDFLIENNLEAKQKDIDDFLNTIVKEYSQSISHYSSEGEIYNIYIKILKVVEKAKNICIKIMIILIVLLLVLNLKQFLNFCICVGVSVLASGLLLAFCNIYIYSKIDIANITILNNAFSDVLENIMETILQDVLSKGIILSVIGIVLIVISNFRKNFKTELQDEEYI